VELVVKEDRGEVSGGEEGRGGRGVGRNGEEMGKSESGGGGEGC